MVEIGGRPILWHVMKIYSAHGINDFVICLGYKGYIIKEYFNNYFLHMSNVTFDMKNNKMQVHRNNSEPWMVTLVDTGEQTMTGGRLKRVREYIGDDDFCLTYGDGVSDVDVTESIKFHKERGRLATVTVAQPPGRFGAVCLENGSVTRFQEKPEGDGSWINAGFFVLSPKVIDYIEDDKTIWERAPMERLAREGQLNAWTHDGFWHAMDTLRDKTALDEMWASGRAPWRVW